MSEKFSWSAFDFTKKLLGFGALTLVIALASSIFLGWVGWAWQDDDNLMEVNRIKSRNSILEMASGDKYVASPEGKLAQDLHDLYFPKEHHQGKQANSYYTYNERQKQFQDDEKRIRERYPLLNEVVFDNTFFCNSGLCSIRHDMHASMKALAEFGLHEAVTPVPDRIKEKGYSEFFWPISELIYQFVFFLILPVITIGMIKLDWENIQKERRRRRYKSEGIVKTQIDGLTTTLEYLRDQLEEAVGSERKKRIQLSIQRCEDSLHSLEDVELDKVLESAEDLVEGAKRLNERIDQQHREPLKIVE